MLHPLLTLLFDLFLVGAASLVVVAMIHEYLVHREPCVGSTRSAASASRRPTTRTMRPVRKPLPVLYTRRTGTRRFAA